MLRILEQIDKAYSETIFEDCSEADLEFITLINKHWPGISSNLKEKILAQQKRAEFPYPNLEATATVDGDRELFKRLSELSCWLIVPDREYWQDWRTGTVEILQHKYNVVLEAYTALWKIVRERGLNNAV